MFEFRLVLVAAAIFGVSATALRAEPPREGEAAVTSLDALVDAIRSNRKAMVAVNLELTDAEASRFWPVYDRYQKDIDTIGDRMVALIQDYVGHYSELSDEKATKLVEEYLEIESDRVEVRRSYLAEFGMSLPARKVARFYQIENKMDAVIRYDLAATIPVLEPQRAGASAPAQAR